MRTMFSVLLLLLLTACNSPEPPDAAATGPASSPQNESPQNESPQNKTVPTTDAGSGLSVQDARVQLMPGMGAAYLSVVHGGGEPDRLVRVETPIAARVESHESVEEDGVMKMVPHPDGFPILAGETLVLEPGAKHLMLMDLASAVPGETVEMTLHFAVHEPITVTARVLSLDDMMTSGGSHESHDPH